MGAPLIKATLNQIIMIILWILPCGKMSISIYLWRSFCKRASMHTPGCTPCVCYCISLSWSILSVFAYLCLPSFQVQVSPKLILQLAWSRYSGEIMERIRPIDVQLASLPSPENKWRDRCGDFREQEVGVGSGVEGRGLEKMRWNRRKGGRRGSMKGRWKVGEKKASEVCKWVEVRKEHQGLRRWGVDVRCSIKLCEDSVINPLKMSDCRWLWEYQSGGGAWG